jgi:hypothetical protein
MATLSFRRTSENAKQGSRNNPASDAVPSSTANHTEFVIPTRGSAVPPARD